jgi:uncharacterized iron-regulated membrane protein
MSDAVTVAGDARVPRLTARCAAALLRVVLWLHRYLAVAVGLLMTLWCLSGFVMMVQSYPSLTDAERRAGLAPLDSTACCAGAAELPFADDALAPAQWRVERLLGRAVLRVGSATAGTFDLATGERIGELSLEDVRLVAAEHGRRHGFGEPRRVEPIDIDQWTMQTAQRYRPAYRVEFADDAGTQVYVSGASGEVFQDTSRRERVLSWIGAIPHWLYPTALRRNGALWSEVVISTSLLGTFLAATGLYVGIVRLRRGRDGRLGSPFRGWWYWHHVSGLVFGVLTLTWVFSGLLTMSPWGVLEGTGARDYLAAARGVTTWREVKQLLANLPRAFADDRFVQVSAAVLGDRLYAVAVDGDGNRLRLDRAGALAPLEAAEIDAAVARIDVPIADARLLEREDSYHYAHKNEAELPIYRVILDDAERTRLYVSPTTGAIRGVDATARASRWLRFGLHDLDFAGLRVRPVWYVAVGALLLGVTLTCAIGTWLALKRLRRDMRSASRRWRRLVGSAAS